MNKPKAHLLLSKELRLSTSPLTVIFLSFTLMVFIPGYPLLVMAFFICLGMFQSFQSARESGDILFTALLPIRKSDVPRAKFISAVMFELISVLLASTFTAVRLCFLADMQPYVTNPLMPACPTLIAFMLIVFSEFNRTTSFRMISISTEHAAPRKKVGGAMLLICKKAPKEPKLSERLGSGGRENARRVARPCVLLSCASMGRGRRK